METQAFEDIIFSELDQLYKNAMDNVQRIRESGEVVYPPEGQELSALNSFNGLKDIKVVILGQDPYHGPNQAHGMSFSVNEGNKIPPSLVNIYKELQSDLGITTPKTGFLKPWASQGVLLLNRVLTVSEGAPGSHANIGWEKFTDTLIKAVDQTASPCVFLLWGKKAQEVIPMIQNPNNLILTSAHPSPFSAHRGFLGCKHFSKTNDFLLSKGKKPIDWRL